MVPLALGPNASGKSNFVEALDFWHRIQATLSRLQEFFGLKDCLFFMTDIQQAGKYQLPCPRVARGHYR